MSVVHDDLHDIRAVAEFHARLFDVLVHRNHDGAARRNLRQMGARNAVAAQTNHLVLQFHAAFDQHVEDLVGVFGHREREVAVIEPAARGDHVFDELFGRVFNAFFPLHLRAGHAHERAAKSGVAAVGLHLFEDENALDAFLLGLIGRRQTGEARAHDHHVVGFVPMIHAVHVEGRRGGARTRGKRRADRALQEAAARKSRFVRHFGVSLKSPYEDDVFAPSVQRELCAEPILYTIGTSLVQRTGVSGSIGNEKELKIQSGEGNGRKREF